MGKSKKRAGFGKSVIAVVLLGVCVAFAFAFVGSFIIDRIMYPYSYREIIESEAEAFGVDPLLVAAVIREESKFAPASESHQGAKGLMQIMPSTGQYIAERLGDVNYREEDLFDPETSIRYGTWYLAELHRNFDNNTALVAAAYNGGRGHVQEWIDSGRIDPDNVRVEDIPFAETRLFVERVLGSYEKYKEIYG